MEDYCYSCNSSVGGLVITKNKKSPSKFSLLKKKLLAKITNIFYREEKPEYALPERWEKEKMKKNPLEVPHKPAYSPKMKQKIRIPLLRPMKRYIAFFLLLINVFLGFVSLTSPIGGPLGFFFLLNAFICLDYLWKTSHWKIVKEE